MTTTPTTQPQAELLPFAKELIQWLPGKWLLSAKDNYAGFHLLDHPDEPHALALFIERDGSRLSARYSLQGALYHEYTSCTHGPIPEITVSGDSTPERFAGHIRRRLLPDARALHQRLKDAYRRTTEHATTRTHTLKQIAEALTPLGPAVQLQDGRVGGIEAHRVRLCGSIDEYGSADFEAASDDTVKINWNWLPRPAALAGLRAIAEALTTEPDR